jgi:hypothetical protein
MQSVRIELFEGNADLERLDDLSRNLRNDLRHREISVDLLPARAPSGAKSGTAVTVGALVALVMSSPAVASLVTGIFDWLGRSRVRSVKISCGDKSIELSSATAEERRRLIELLEEHIRTEEHPPS